MHLRAIAVMVLIIVVAISPSAKCLKVDLSAQLGTLSPVPVTTGIPLPEGAVEDPSALLLTDADQSVPVQVKPLSRWPDGSIRWAQLDFSVVNREPGSTTAFVLTDSAQVPVAEAQQTVHLTENAKAITVDTGPLQFSVSRQRFNALEDVWVDGRQAVPGVHSAGLKLALDDYTLASGSLRPTQVVVEEAGPLKAVIRSDAVVRSSTGPSFVVSFRIHAYAGSRLVRIDHTFTNKGHSVLRLKEFVLQIPLAFPAQTGQVSMEGSNDYSADLTKGTLRLAQSQKHLMGMAFLHRFNVTIDDEIVTLGKRASGWIQANGTDVQATVAMRDFWQLYPKGLSVSPQQISVEFWPAGSQITPTGHMDLNAGAAFTHQLMVAFSTDGSVTGQSLAEHLAHPPLALPSPQWFAATGATLERTVSPAVVQGKTLHPEWDALVDWMVFEKLLTQREENDEYGLMHYGDYLLSGRVWNNLQYDLPHSLMQQFYRTGDRRYLDMAWAMVRHQQNADILWHSNIANGARTHRGYGGEWEQGKPHGISGATEANLFVAGMIDIYSVTGEARTLEAIKWVADGLANYKADSMYIFQPRGLGWRTGGYPLSVLAQVYDLTLDEKYRNAATSILQAATLSQAHTSENGYAKEIADGVWWEEVAGGWENQAWMIDLMGAGLFDVYRIMEPGPLKDKTAAAIIDLAEWAQEKAWNTKERGWFVRFTKDKSASYNPTGTYGGFMAALGLTTTAAAFELTGDTKYMDFGRTLLETVLQSPKYNIVGGKQIGQTMQYTPYFLAVWDDYTGAWPTGSGRE